MNTRHHFVLQYTDAVPGDSGGVVIGPKGEILGLLFELVKVPDLSYTYVLGVKMTVAMELISIYSSSLKKKVAEK